MTTPVFDQIAQVLQEAVRRYPHDGLTEQRRIAGLLADHVADAQAQNGAVLVALQDGVAQELRQSPLAELGLQMNRLAQRLAQSKGLREDLALGAVQACAHALGLAPLPSQQAAGLGAGGGAAPAAAAEAAAATTSDWVGMTQFPAGPVAATPSTGAAAARAAPAAFSSAPPAPPAPVAPSSASSFAPATSGVPSAPLAASSTGLGAWLKQNQTAVGLVSAAVVAISAYFNSNKAPAPPPPAQPPVAGPGAPPTAEPAQTGGQRPVFVAGPNTQPQNGQPQSGQPQLPQPQQHPHQQPPGAAGTGAAGGGQVQQQTMAWYDDQSNRWDVQLRADGQFQGVASLGDGKVYRMQGSVANNALRFAIFNEAGQQVSDGTGTVKDQTHLQVQVKGTQGQVIYSGQLHINHAPNKQGG